MSDTTLVGVDDACAGLETPDGRVFHVRDHIAELPNDVAAKFFKAGRTDHLHRHRPVGIGWSRRREQALARIFPDKES